MSSPFTVPPHALDDDEIKRRQRTIAMRAVVFFLCVSAVVMLALPLPLPMPLRVAVAAIDLIAALVVYAIYRAKC
ncbi:MAG: hypothetical protein RIQ79_1280 [Verrucomicrobiota bacterium]|jgi:hypothetical protein